jgi:hypothetical protein
MRNRIALFAFIVGAVAACDMTGGAATQQLLYDTQDAMQQLRSELAIFQDEIDSLRVDLHVQDSLLRDLANQMGRPIPAKAQTFIPPS